MKALTEAKDGIGHEVEMRKPPMNQYTIFWSYAQREIGHFVNKKFTFALMDKLGKENYKDSPIW